MPFRSILTDLRTNPAQFREKILRIDGFEKRSFFESAISEFVFQIFFFFFLIIEGVKGYWVAKMGQNFDENTGFQPMRSGANTWACTARTVFPD